MVFRGTSDPMRRRFTLLLTLCLAGCAAPNTERQQATLVQTSSIEKPGVNPAPRGPDPTTPVVKQSAPPALQGSGKATIPQQESPHSPGNIPEIKSVEQTATKPVFTSKVSETDIGVSFYPNSEPFPSDDFKSVGPKGSTSTSARLTHSKGKEVLEYYQKVLGQPLTSNLKSEEPLAVWQIGKAYVSISTRASGEQTEIIVTTSPV